METTHFEIQFTDQERAALRQLIDGAVRHYGNQAVPAADFWLKRLNLAHEVKSEPPADD